MCLCFQQSIDGSLMGISSVLFFFSYIYNFYWITFTDTDRDEWMRLTCLWCEWLDPFMGTIIDMTDLLSTWFLLGDVFFSFCVASAFAIHLRQLNYRHSSIRFQSHWSFVCPKNKHVNVDARWTQTPKAGCRVQCKQWKNEIQCPLFFSPVFASSQQQPAAATIHSVCICIICINIILEVNPVLFSHTMKGTELIHSMFPGPVGTTNKITITWLIHGTCCCCVVDTIIAQNELIAV